MYVFPTFEIVAMHTGWQVAGGWQDSGDKWWECFPTEPLWCSSRGKRSQSVGETHPAKCGQYDIWTRYIDSQLSDQWKVIYKGNKTPLTSLKGYYFRICLWVLAFHNCDGHGKHIVIDLWHSPLGIYCICTCGLATCLQVRVVKIYHCLTSSVAALTLQALKAYHICTLASLWAPAQLFLPRVCGADVDCTHCSNSHVAALAV